MAEAFGLDADVYFGDFDEPLPDWRTAVNDDEDDEPTEDEQDAAVAVLGFDPDDEEGDDDE